MKDTVDQKIGIDSAAAQNSEDSSHGQVVGYIDPAKEARMMRKFDVSNFATTYSSNLTILICVNTVLGSRPPRHSLHVSKSRPVSLLTSLGNTE